MERICALDGKPERETAREDFLEQEYASDVLKHELNFDTLGADFEPDVIGKWLKN